MSYRVVDDVRYAWEHGYPIPTGGALLLGQSPAVGAAIGPEIDRPPTDDNDSAVHQCRGSRTVRAECLDWTLIWNRRHLERVLTIYVQHYNTARPHRSINLAVPVPLTSETNTGPIERLDLLGGLIHEYRHAA